MLTFLQKRWFLISLVVLIGGGLWFGTQLSHARAEQLASRLNTKLVTAAVLFLMAFSLDSHQLKTSLRFPAPVLWASATNYVVIPALALCLLPWQKIDDFKYGLMIAASVPCTLAAASVWTRKARGNDAVSLLVTLLTNGVCFAVTPFWLSRLHDVRLDARSLVLTLIACVLIPTLIGQVVRQVRRLEVFAVRHKIAIGVLAQILVLSQVFSAAAFKAGPSLNADASAADSIVQPTIAAVVVVWSSCIALHLAGMAIAVLGARAFGFRRADCAAVAFAGSQKTMPIGIVLADAFANLGFPFAVFPMLMYHASQLFIDTVVADRMAVEAAVREQQEQPAS
jgi:sodium/bile acid cotransporter 7